MSQPQSSANGASASTTGTANETRDTTQTRSTKSANGTTNPEANGTSTATAAATTTTTSQSQSQTTLENNKNTKEPKKILRKKVKQPFPLKKYAWLVGHGVTIVFSIIYFSYYFTRRSHSSIIAFLSYKLAICGVWSSYTASILSQFNKKSLPSYYVLLATVNFQYLLLSILWFFNRASAYKILPFFIVSVLQLSLKFNVQPILSMDSQLKLVIAYDEIFVFVILFFDTLLLRGTSGFGLVIYAMFFWLRMLYSESTRFLVFSVLIKFDGVISKVQNEKVQSIWNNMKDKISAKQSKMRHDFDISD
ncbi:hypothetical protein BVG19_g1548 [[Candida] boidinii]|nr:hypothetical protein BVG19_g1548 [[Candida] boidinii]OWB50296.1 hypothetical protein B5S27_g1844 [[Candida] boidinii]